jgi:hypothetical protein
MSNGRVSRLYRSLVRDQQIAAEAEGVSPYPGDKYPSLFVFFAAPLPGHTPQEMRDAIHKEIEKLKTTDVTDDELAMYKTRTRADLLRGLADNQGLANDLAEYQTRYGDWRELFLQLDKVDKVTKADIRRVANKVFVSSNRTEAWTKPPPSAPGQPRQPRKTEVRNENSLHIGIKALKGFDRNEERSRIRAVGQGFSPDNKTLLLQDPGFSPRGNASLKSIPLL